jgi:hypothetical protein
MASSSTFFDPTRVTEWLRDQFLESTDRVVQIPLYLRDYSGFFFGGIQDAATPETPALTLPTSVPKFARDGPSPSNVRGGLDC